jgi:site-specific DNA-methyltransferase (adenine-specific)
MEEIKKYNSVLKIEQGDCLQLLPLIENKSVNLILTDLPYGTSACSWDTVIRLEPLWYEFERIIKDDGAIVLTSNQPFTSKLVMSNPSLFKYSWVWVKDNATNFLNKKYQAGKITEDILVFGKMATSYSKKGNMKYNPQLEEGKPYKITNSVSRRTNAVIRSEIVNVETDNKGTRLPNNVIYFTRDKLKIHPTQKPVALMEYLIKTYSDENDIVLDATMGSGTTGVACIRTNRNFIGFEKDKDYFNVAKRRLLDEAL